MNPKTKEAQSRGVLLNQQSFTTPKGIYTLVHRRWEGEIYLYKHLNGKLVEAKNLSRMRGVGEDD